jgi:hypothetical protein
VSEDRFYILTHPEMSPGIRARMDAILDGQDPPFPAFRGMPGQPQ